MRKDDLYFLLKDKYLFSEPEIERFLSAPNSNNNPEIKRDIELLKNNYPLDYIIGYTDFLGLKIKLNRKPLIPRPETEFWAEKVITEINTKLTNKKNDFQFLDIFCGSGCIGLSILKHCNIEKIHGSFVDINDEFLLQTQENAIENQIELRKLSLIKSNIFENVIDTYDLLVANPPYVSEHDEVGDGIKFEPAQAIYAERGGIEVIKSFLEEAIDFLCVGGKLYMEFGSNQKELINELLINRRFTSWEFFKDQFGKWRWIEIIK